MAEACRRTNVRSGRPGVDAEFLTDSRRALSARRRAFSLFIEREKASLTFCSEGVALAIRQPYLCFLRRLYAA